MPFHDQHSQVASGCVRGGTAEGHPRIHESSALETSWSVGRARAGDGGAALVWRCGNVPKVSWDRIPEGKGRSPPGFSSSEVQPRLEPLDQEPGRSWCRWEVIWDEAREWAAPSKSCCWISSLSSQGSDHPGGNIPAVPELLNLPLLFQRRRRSRPESKCRSTASPSLPLSRSWDLGWPPDSRPLWPPRSRG